MLNGKQSAAGGRTRDAGSCVTGNKCSSGPCCSGLEILTEGGTNIMNWNQIEGRWRQVKGSVGQRWGRLTESDLEVIGGRKDVLVGKIQERYGIAKENGDRQVQTWYKAVMKG
jgi:uncharacterized protein YjbJ (UPF0337 family)